MSFLPFLHLWELSIKEKLQFGKSKINSLKPFHSENILIPMMSTQEPSVTLILSAPSVL